MAVRLSLLTHLSTPNVKKLENKSKCEVIIKSGDAGSEQALVVKNTCENNPVGFSGVQL